MDETQMMNTRTSGFGDRRGESKLSTQAKNKKEKLLIYRDVEANYFKRPSNTADFIDKKTMKEKINEGIPYLSTS